MPPFDDMAARHIFRTIGFRMDSGFIGDVKIGTAGECPVLPEISDRRLFYGSPNFSRICRGGAPKFRRQ